MNLKTIVVITGLTLSAGLNFPVSATGINTMTATVGQASTILNQAIAQATPTPSSTMKNPTTGTMSHPNTGNAMKKPTTGAMSNPSTGDAMKKPATGAMSHPSTGDAMKKPTSDAMQKQ